MLYRLSYLGAATHLGSPRPALTLPVARFLPEPDARAQKRGKAGQAGSTQARYAVKETEELKDDNEVLSRSGMIQRLAAAPIAIGAFAALQAEAQAAATTDQKTAAYQNHPNGGKQCSGCALFIPAKSNPMKSPGSCKLVKGTIQPNGWCKFYSPKPK